MIRKKRNVESWVMAFATDYRDFHGLVLATNYANFHELSLILFIVNKHISSSFVLIRVIRGYLFKNANCFLAKSSFRCHQQER